MPDALPCGCRVSFEPPANYVFLKCDEHKDVAHLPRPIEKPWSHILVEEVERLRALLRGVSKIREYLVRVAKGEMVPVELNGDRANFVSFSVESSFAHALSTLRRFEERIAAELPDETDPQQFLESHDHACAICLSSVAGCECEDRQKWICPNGCHDKRHEEASP